MKKKIKCTICGSVLSVLFFVNLNPVCEECLKHRVENPDIIELHSSVEPTGPEYNPGIEVTATATTATVSIGGTVNLELPK